MKVIHLCQSADPNIGGSLTVARALLKAQRALGVDARLLCLYEDLSATAGAPAAEFEIPCDVTRRNRWTKGVAKLRGMLEEMKPDVIHHHDGILWPRVATSRIHALHVTHGHLGRPQTGPFSAAYWTHRYIAKHTECLIAISAWVAESWRKGGFPQERIRLVPNGVDCARFHRRSPEQRHEWRKRHGLPEEARLLLWAGRLDRETKGLDRLVSVARSLPPGTHLAVAGGGPSEDWLQGELKSLSPRVSLLGKVPDPADVFGSSDAFLFTSRVEPFGLVLLEAAASELPIFAFGCEGGGQDLLQELCAFIASDETGTEMISALSKNWPESGPAIAAIVRQRYSWEQVAHTVQKAYAEFLPTPQTSLKE